MSEACSHPNKIVFKDPETGQDREVYCHDCGVRLA